MKLSDLEAKKICKLYNLGEFLSFRAITSGYVNNDFLFKTTKGDFMVQALGGRFSKWKRDSMRLEFDVLDFLRRNKFPYEIPNPIKNGKGKFLSNIARMNIWVYPYIEGIVKDSLSKKEFVQLAKACAVYHKFIKPFRNKNRKFYLNFSWISKKYKSLKRLKPSNKINKLMLDNIEFYICLIKKLQKINYGKFTFIHGDLDGCNVIFDKKGKLTGIIDFDNIEYAPLAKDLAIINIRENYLNKGWSKSKLKFFLREYEKVNPLDKKTKDLVIICALKDYCTVFWWYFGGMTKHRERAYNHMNDTLKKTKLLLKEANLD